MSLFEISDQKKCGNRPCKYFPFRALVFLSFLLRGLNEALQELINQLSDNPAVGTACHIVNTDIHPVFRSFRK